MKVQQTKIECADHPKKPHPYCMRCRVVGRVAERHARNVKEELFFNICDSIASYLGNMTFVSDIDIPALAANICKVIDPE